jgi:NAD(P)-dependent dehydrogenase (short-subunit alcohol dehydrogenase family)
MTRPVGKVALVTGGANGIGKAVALRLARDGCAVGILDVDAGEMDRTAAEIRALGRSAAFHSADVANVGAVKAAVEAIEDELGPTDILVNNAGIAKLAPLLELSEADWRRHFSINVDGVWNACRAVVPRMRDRRHGVVINMSSWLGKRGMANFGAYSATKFAIIGLTQSLALEVASSGVRVNALCPGLIINTPMRDILDEQSASLRMPLASERAAAIPLRRAGSAEDVASAASYLASEDAAYLTGTTIDVAGGLWMS